MACERKFLRPAIGKPAGHGPYNGTSCQHHDACEQHQKWKQHRQHLAREGARGGKARLCLFALRLGHFLVEQRDKNGSKCAFSEQCTKQIGQPPRNQKRVGRKACTDVARHQHVAHKTKHAADQSQPPNGNAVSNQAHMFTWCLRLQASPAGCVSAICCACVSCWIYNALKSIGSRTSGG